MQNEELQHVFNLSEHQSHRYNGYYISPVGDRTSTKTKKGSPKKKNADMVTAATKSVIRRRSKIKNSIGKAEDVINGVATAADNAFSKNKNLYFDKHRTQGVNHFINHAKADAGSLESISSILSNLNKNSDPTNHRLRVCNVDYNELPSHVRSSETSTSLHARNQYNNSSEFDVRSSITKVTNQKLNHVSTPGRKTKSDESKTKCDELSFQLSSTSQYRLPPSYSFYDDLAHRADLRYSEGRKDTEKTSLSEPTINKSCESKLFLQMKRRQNRRKWQMDNGTRHEALQRIRGCVELHENLQNDLFPLNLGETSYEKCDSDSSDESPNTFQNHWFHSMSEIEFDDVKRNLRLGQLYNELRRQVYQIKQNKCESPVMNDKVMKSLVDVARVRPTDAMHCIEKNDVQLAATEPLILSKKKCALETCKNVAIPCMPTCVRHILLCDKQMLFEQCRVRDSNSFQCDRPVLNIKYHYPVCSVHSKPEFVLPDFSREDIKYEDVRRTNVSNLSAKVYKMETNLANLGAGPESCLSASSKVETKKRANSGGINAGSSAKHQFNAHLPMVVEKREKEKKSAERKEPKMIIARKEETKPKVMMPVVRVSPPKPKETNKSVITSIKEEPAPSLVQEVNPNLLRDWVSLSDSQLVDTKTLESTLQNDFVNGFEISASTIQSQIQDIINSESSLSTDMLMGTHGLPNYIQVEEMIEEVEITDETLDSSELGNQELVHSEDLNAVLKQLPPEAFNELFSEFTLSEG